MTEIIFLEEKKDLESKAADIIVKSIERLLAKKDIVVFAIPGGKSVPSIFRELKKRPVPWEKVHIFMVDERLVPITDKESNFLLARENFIDELVGSGKLPKENTHPFILNPDKEDAGIGEYAEELRGFNGKYDVVLLSSGEDGHVGALYPDHASIKDDSGIFIVMHDSPKPPKDRMTMSRVLLENAGTAILLIFGEAKRDALRNFMDKSVAPEQCPAKLVYSINDSYALTDVKI